MNWWKVALYWVLAGLLTLNLVRHEASLPGGGELEGEAKGTLAMPFLEAVPERIDRVRLEKGDAAIDYQRKDGRWVVLQPAGLRPPGDVIDAMLDSLTTLPPVQVVAEGVEQQGQFGLEPPFARIRLEQQGSVVSTIVLGTTSPTGTAVYAKQSGRDQVMLIGLNARYYVDLAFEDAKRQAAAGPEAAPAVEPSSGEPAGDAAVGKQAEMAAQPAPAKLSAPASKASGKPAAATKPAAKKPAAKAAPSKSAAKPAAKKTAPKSEPKNGTKTPAKSSAKSAGSSATRAGTKPVSKATGSR